jgi:hypothetical protein
MNKLTLAKRGQILSMLAKGSSMRSVFRIGDITINTGSGLLVGAGKLTLNIMILRYEILLSSAPRRMEAVDGAFGSVR